MKKASIIIGILLFLCVAVLPVKTRAETEGCFTYTVSLGKVAISDCDDSASGELTIPDTLGGYPVTSIEKFAFNECNALTAIHIPASVTKIADGAFSATRGLTGIWVAEDNPAYTNDSKGVLYSKDMKKVVAAPLKLSGTYTIAEGVTEIGCSAFSQCENLKKVNIPETVTKIGGFAFMRCYTLEAVSLPATVTELGEYAFMQCSSLKNVVIPEGVVKLEDNAFFGCNRNLDYGLFGVR